MSRKNGRAVTVRCPYQHCGEQCSVDCSSPHDDKIIAECWECGSMFVVRFTVSIEGEALMIQGEQQALNARLIEREGSAEPGAG